MKPYCVTVAWPDRTVFTLIVPFHTTARTKEAAIERACDVLKTPRRCVVAVRNGRKPR